MLTELTLLKRNRMSLARRRENLASKSGYETLQIHLYQKARVMKWGELVPMSGYESFAHNTALL